MKNQTLELYKNRYIVRLKTVDPAPNARKILLDLAKLRDRVSKKWQGKQDAVQEIREQRSGLL